MEKSEQEIIEEIINSVKIRRFNAWIKNLTFSEDDWEDDFDTMREATEALNDALDDNGRDDCEWGIEEVRNYNEQQIESAIKKALQKGKELKESELVCCGIHGYKLKEDFCGGCNNYLPYQKQVNLDTGFLLIAGELVSCRLIQKRTSEEQASKIAELEKENRELKEQNSKLADELIQECCESWEAPYEDTACCDIPNMPFEDMCSTCRIVVKTKNLNRC